MGRLMILAEATPLMTLVGRVKEHVKMSHGEILLCGTLWPD